jgi:hypothetical protein
VYDLGTPAFWYDSAWIRYLNTTGITSQVVQVGNVRYTGLAGVAGQVLTTDGVGNTYWSNVAGGNADLGNWAFIGNTQYNINGGSVTNGDLLSGPTAALILPTNGAINNTTTLFNLYGNLALQTGNNTGVTAATWTFDNNGQLLAPLQYTTRGDISSGTVYGYTLSLTDNNYESVITTANGDANTNINSQRLVINPGKGADGTGGEGGDIYLWAGRGGDTDGNGGDVKIRGGYGPGNGSGGYIRVEAGDVQSAGTAGYLYLKGGDSGGGSGGYVEILGGYGGSGSGGAITVTGGYGGDGPGGNVTIGGGISTGGLGFYGNVLVNAGASQWRFENNGNITLPSDTSSINYANGNPYGGGGNTFASITMTNTPMAASNVIQYGLGNLISWLDGEWTIGEFNGNLGAPNSGLGNEGIRIDPGIESNAGMTFPSVLNQSSQPVQIYSTSGSGVVLNVGTGSYSFRSNGNIDLPSNTSNINYANGVSILDGVISNYGDSNVVTLMANFGSNVISTTGNITANTFVGDQANIELVANVYIWTFDNTGNLTAPGNIILDTNQAFWAYSNTGLTVTANIQSDVNGVSMENGVDTYTYANANVVIQTNVGNAGNVYGWTFDSTGNLGASGNMQLVSNSNLWNFDTNGQLFAPGNVVTTGNVSAGAFVGTNPNVEVIAGSYAWTFDTAGNVTFQGGTGNIELAANTAVWTFDTTGNVTVSGNTTVSTVSATGAVDGYNIAITAGSADLGDYYTTSGGDVVITGGVGAFNDGGGGGPGGSIYLTTGNSADPAGHAGNVNITAGSNSWVFDYTGNLTIPGNVVQGNSKLSLNENGGNTAYLTSTVDDLTAIYMDANDIQIYANGNVSISAFTSHWTFDNTGALTAPGDITTTGNLSVYDATISGNINGSKNFDLDGNATIGGNLFVTGNINFTGNVTQISGNSGVFYGNISTGIGAIYAGKTGYTPLPNTVVQITGDDNSYTQVNLQNTNHGNVASMELAITADDGTDTTNYLDMGIASSVWDGTQDNSLGSAVQRRDGYLYVQGGAAGGNLVLGTTTAGYGIKFNAGGSGSANTVAQISNTGITTSGAISATGNVRGAYILGDGSLLSNIQVSGSAPVSTTGNVTGGNLVATGVVSASGNISANYFFGNGSQLTGLPAAYSNSNVTTLLAGFGSNTISTTGTVTAGNITGANILTGGAISATGTVTSAANVIGGNLSTAGQVNATGNITGANILTGGAISATGNVRGGNLLGVGISASGTVTATSLQVTGATTLSDVTATGNATIGTALTIYGSNNTITTQNGSAVQFGQRVNFNSTNGIFVTGNVNAQSNLIVSGFSVTSGNASVTGNVISGNVTTTGLISATGNITGGNILGGANVNATTYTGTTVSVSANITGGNLLTAGLISATGNITAANLGNISSINLNGNASTVLYGNGVFAAVAAGSSYGNSNVTTLLAAYGSNTISTTGTVNAGNITGGNVLTGGLISASSNITGGNILTAGIMSSTGNATHGNILTGGLITATGNIIGGNISTAGTASVTGNLNVGSNATATLQHSLLSGIQLAPAANAITANAAVSIGGSGSNYLALGQYPVGSTLNGVSTAYAQWIQSGYSQNATYYPIVLNPLGGNVQLGGNIIAPGAVLGNSATVTTANYAIGYRDLPQISFAGNATIAAADAGKHYYSTLSTGNTLTIANNSSVSWTVGTAISIVNRGTGNITIAQDTGVSLYLAGNATAGNRTVTTYGMATLLNVAANVWMINGTGVS